MNRLMKAGKYPPLAMVCVDAAGQVWAAEHGPGIEPDPHAEALNVGSVVRVGDAWAFETTERGRGRTLYANAHDAGVSLCAALDGSWKERGRRAA